MAKEEQESAAETGSTHARGTNRTVKEGEMG